jgi:hypothetical protein
VLVLISLNCIPANAWGAPGHHVVAMIAERHLTPKAKQAIAEILGADVSLASVATYAEKKLRNLRLQYGLYWNRHGNSFCPGCRTPFTGYSKDARGSVLGCAKGGVVALRDSDGADLTLRDA